MSPASATLRAPTGKPATRDQSSSVTTANNARPARRIAAITTTPRAPTIATPVHVTAYGSPNRYGSVSSSSPPARLANTAPIAIPT